VKPISLLLFAFFASSKTLSVSKDYGLKHATAAIHHAPFRHVAKHTQFFAIITCHLFAHAAVLRGLTWPQRSTQPVGKLALQQGLSGNSHWLHLLSYHHRITTGHVYSCFFVATKEEPPQDKHIDSFLCELIVALSFESTSDMSLLQVSAMTPAACTRHLTC